MKLVGLRGAITCEANTAEDIQERTQRLLKELLARNEIDHDDLVSIIFTATEDLDAEFPAAAARAIGFGDVPLLCAREIDVAGKTQKCIRILIHCYSEKTRPELHHVYLEGARGLRDDLPE